MGTVFQKRLARIGKPLDDAARIKAARHPDQEDLVSVKHRTMAMSGVWKVERCSQGGADGVH